MSETNSLNSISHVRLTTDVVCSYVAKNHVAPSKLPNLIASVHDAFLKMATGASPNPEGEVIKQLSTAQVRKSITPAALISFIDGRGYKTLKRHLTKHGLNPASYRARFSLPSDYPMVASDYSATRTALAQQMGLGHKRAQDEEAVPPRAVARRRARQGVH